MTDEMLEAIREKAEKFPHPLAIVEEKHFTPADVIVTPIEDFMLAKVGQTYPRYGGQVYLGHTEASFTKAEAEFISEARGDILALVAEVKRLREIINYAYNGLACGHCEHGTGGAQGCRECVREIRQACEEIAND